MFHMLSSFNIKAGIPIDDVVIAMQEFTDHLLNLDLITSADPIGRRDRDTILDTDDAREHEYFHIMHFRNKAQSESAVQFILSRQQPEASIHIGVYSKLEDMVFTCWQDCPES
ncbi:MAG: hypothetical protein AAF402_09180 [Pseudomonadota bacterium]